MEMIELLYENPRFVVIVKPAGLNFHSEEEAGLVVKTKAMLALEEL